MNKWMRNVRVVLKIASFTLSVMFALNSQGKALPGYSSMYMYDNQDCYTDPNIDNPVHISDPLAPINKQIFYFNWMLDTIIFIPAMQIYVTAVPKRSRVYVSNFISNISEPINFANLLFQGNFKQAQISFARFVTNSLLGFFGIMDVATQFKLPYKGEDFGQTMAYRGVPMGPYLVAPILGPTSFRDLSGKAVDFFIDPFKYVLSKSEREIIDITWLIQKRTDSDAVIKAVKQSIDPYETAKQMYIQNRNNQIEER